MVILWSVYIPTKEQKEEAIDLGIQIMDILCKAKTKEQRGFIIKLVMDILNEYDHTDLRISNIEYENKVN